MKRLMLAVGLAAVAVTPAAGQLAGLPVWNSPKGGTGITVNGDLGLPNEDAGKGTAFAARASLGLANLTISAGAGSYKAEGSDATTTFAGSLAFRVMGGSLLPIAVNVFGGAGTTTEITGGTPVPATSLFLVGAGASASLPVPGLSIEPYLSISNRWHKVSGLSGTVSNVGWTLGANATFGMFGLHVAYDSEAEGGGSSPGIIGIGAHVTLKAPIGM